MEPALEALLARVSDALRGLSGATELYLYGSAVDSDQADAYSDLDLQVVCEGFDTSQANWPMILAHAGEIELAFPIETTPLSAAYSVVFTAESPYHKVDVGLSDVTQENSFIYQIKSKKLLWRQPVLTTSAQPDERVYIPAAGSAAHFMLGELLSAVRYLKARKRGHHLTCWRFLSAKFNALLRCSRWNGDPRAFPVASLSTWDYAALDRQLGESDRLGLLSTLRPASPAEMDRSLYMLTGQIVEAIQPRLTEVDGRAVVFAGHYMEFIERELAISSGFGLF